MGSIKGVTVRKISPALWLAGMACFFALTYAFTQRFSIPQIRGKHPMQNMPRVDTRLSKTQLVQVDSKGDTVLDMKSSSIEMRDNAGGDKSVHFVNISGNFYEDGKPAMLFKGDKALYDAKKKEVLFKHVDASSQSYGAHLSGDEMLWENKKNTLEITKSPVLQKGTLQVSAKLLSARPALKEVKAKGAVKTQESKEKITILADEQNFNFQTGEVTAKGNVRIQKEKLNVQSDEAVYSQKQNVLTLTGNVAILQEDSKVICSHAKLFLDDQKAEADGGVKITRKNLTVQSDKVDFSFKENIIVAQGNVQSVSSGEKETKLSSQSLEAQVDEGKMKATGNVTFSQGNIHLQGGFLSFEDKTGNLLAKDSPRILMKDEKGNETTLLAETVQGNLKDDAPYLTAKNNVQLLREGTTVQADEAMFLLKDQKVTFKGSVHLAQGENELQGEQLTFFIKENKFKITGNTKIKLQPQKKNTEETKKQK